MYTVSQPWPPRLLKNPLPSSWWKPESCPQCATDGWKIHAIATNVSGIIESSARIVANAVPNRIPRYAGMKNSRIPTIEIHSVLYEMNVLSGATGNQPSQYAHAVMPLMCFAARGQRSLYAGYAYDGEPPVRSGIIAESSARSRQSR